VRAGHDGIGTLKANPSAGQAVVFKRSCVGADAKYLQFGDTQLSSEPPISRCEADRFQVTRVVRSEAERMRSHRQHQSCEEAAYGSLS
jgi:hypothetical protein